MGSTIEFLSLAGFSDPVAFRLGPVAVRWYGLALAASYLIGLVYLTLHGRRAGLKEEVLTALASWCFLGGLVGARLLFVTVNFPHWFWQSPLEVLKVYEGGLAWHGGLLGGLAAGLTFLRRQPSLSFNRVADLIVPGLALGYTLVRLANIVNVEVVGRTTQWGFIWPSQLLGSAMGLVLLVRHLILAAKARPPGYLFWSFVFYHQLLRGLVEESLREMPVVFSLYVNPAWGMGLVTLGQLATLPIVVTAYVMTRRSLSPAPNVLESVQPSPRQA